MLDFTLENNGGGGTTYTAGNGINISNNEISADTQVLAEKSELAGKQNTLTPAVPISITQETISPTHNYTVSGTTANPQYTAHNIGIVYNSLVSMVLSGSSGGISYAPNFNEWCKGNLSWVDVPCDFNSSINSLNIGGFNNDNLVLIYCNKTDEIANPKFCLAINKTGGSYGFAHLTSFHFSGPQQIEYKASGVSLNASTTESTGVNNLSVQLTNNTSSIDISAVLQFDSQKVTATGSLNIDGTALLDLLSVNCIRIFTKSMISTDATTYGSWSLTNGTITYQAITLKIDNNTLKVNANGELYVDVSALS